MTKGGIFVSYSLLCKGRFLIACRGRLWYSGYEEGGEKNDDSVYQSALPRSCDFYNRSGKGVDRGGSSGDLSHAPAMQVQWSILS